jgi:DNA topoisomerase IB
LTGCEITAKDFRTWAGTVLAANLLHETGKPDSATAAKRQIRAALHQVAAHGAAECEIAVKWLAQWKVDTPPVT